MRILIITILLALASCTSTKPLDNDFDVFIGKVNWVKLFPNEPVVTSKNTDGIEEIVISNSCGIAEVQYTTHRSKTKVVWMRMGEWCKTPFDINYDYQLVFSSSQGELLEYYQIEEVNDEKLIILSDPWDLEHSQLKDLVKFLEKPFVLYEVDEESLGWARMMENEGMVEIKDQNIWLKKAVNLNDVITKFQL